MKRRTSEAWAARPRKPIFYGPLARLADRWAGAKDGRASIPATSANQPATSASATPFTEIRSRHFRDRAERERLHYEHDTATLHDHRTAAEARLAGAEATVADLGKQLEELPEAAGQHVLTRRNAVEQHADEALIRTRRQREYDAVRRRLVAREREAAQAAQELRVEVARLKELIAARHRVLDCRVRQLHEHTMRRCGTYARRLVHKHPEGPAVIPFLDLGMPALPEWLQQGPSDAS